MTTVSAVHSGVAPPRGRTLPVHGGPQELRRVLPARLPGRPTDDAPRVAAALRTAAPTDAAADS